MSNAGQAIDRDEDLTLEQQLPELLDEVLGRLSQVAVDRILELAGELAEARAAEPATAHLVPTPNERN